MLPAQNGRSLKTSTRRGRLDQLNSSRRALDVSSSASIKHAPSEGIMFDNLDGHRAYEPLTFQCSWLPEPAHVSSRLMVRIAQRVGENISSPTMGTIERYVLPR